MFTNKQKHTLLSNAGYKGPATEESMNLFIEANPAAAAKIGKFETAAKKIMEKPAPLAAMQSGGLAAATADVSSTFKEAEAPTIEATKVEEMTEENKPKTQIAFDEDLATAEAETIADDTGDIAEPVEEVKVETGETTTATAPEVKDAVTYDATTSGEAVEEALTGLEAQQGELTKKATVRGQLDELMKDFDDGTPPWASGALRAATAGMAARGLGSSSMAGEAIVKAAMESALPIAAADAKTQAQMEFKNLDNRQSTAIFKTQQRVATILSDTSMQNAAKQFNAQSENQVNMFKSQMTADIEKFNSSQINAMVQFNAGQKNAVAQFNSNMKEQRAQFNAKNDVIIQQANVQMRNDMFQQKLRIQTERDVTQAQITSAEAIAERKIEFEQKQQQAAIDSQRRIEQAKTQAQVNMQNAQLAHDATQQQLAREQRAELDALARAHQTQENNANRSLQLLTTTMASQTQIEMAKMAESSAEKAGIGQLIGTAIGLGI